VSGNRTTGPLEVLLSVRRGAGSFRGQLERELRGAVRSGRLPAGTALPSTRALASQLGVSRGVVVEAYDQLVAEGYLLARQGSATRVAETAAAAKAAPSAEQAPQRLRYDFRPGVPALDTFPRTAWLASLRKTLTQVPHAALGYGDPRGLPALREALAAYLGRVRGVAANPERVLVCSGFAQGLGLVCRTLRRGGASRFAVEDPSHPGQRAEVAHAGLEPVPVPVDERGLRVDLLVRSRADAVLVTPAHQFPTGAVLAPERRASLVEWAQRHDAVVVEDDYDAEYRYDREPIGALQGLAPERVIYAGSASKTLAPALRLGWLVLPAWLIDAVAEEKALDDLASPVLEQLAFADFLAQGGADRHLRRNRALYRARRDALVAALAAHLPRVTVGGIAAGLHAVAQLPPDTDEAAVVAAARERSVGVYGMTDYRLPGSLGPAALVLGYGGLGERAIEAGVLLLAVAVSRSGQG
jgi:GntR family transcriptional regulator / MocR family aminotransferase